MTSQELTILLSISINTIVSLLKSEINTNPSLTSDFKNVLSNNMNKKTLIFSPLNILVKIYDFKGNISKYVHHKIEDK
ncbi:uncharacterized protein METZ01_LOCUS368369 [marine metagenome]|uniref:Uncharacterized protein n=1 Tax=marine metagenome TaxID=408172 RepID=A0A382T190_9ZZZZ